MLSKLEVLKRIKIGERVAEEEADELVRYFLETDQWHQMRSGEIDVVYGPKGSGKSALYTLLSKKENELFDDGILIAPAENVRGATVFRSIVSDPPPSELSFIYLWKIYCLILVARTLREYGIVDGDAKALITALEKASLLPTSASLSAMFRAVTSYIKGWLTRDTKAVEYALTIDPATGAPTITRKTEFAEISEAQSLGDIPVEELLEVASNALKRAGLNLWLLFDRLDVAFAESPDLERNALRALFRTYNDLKAYPGISMKVFVRDDIWRRISSGGFTEASHITKSVHIVWGEEGLLNLVILRLLNNPAVVEYAGIDSKGVKSDYQKQRNLFYSLAPDQVDTGKNPQTFNWIVSRTTDASGSSVPREVIHLLEVAKDLQISKLERGGNEPEGSQLFDRAVFKEALPTVSKVRYEQTLLAEYPDVQGYLQKLTGEKAEQSIGTLSLLWKTDDEQTSQIAKRLSDIGFFEIRGTKDEPSYWVPFIYRSALNLVQGKAED
ncbi:P-loop ATPase, Sll1717 family [Achromobacter marplatensis]